MTDKIVIVEAYQIHVDRPKYVGTFQGSPEDIKAYCIENYGEGYGWEFKRHDIRSVPHDYAKKLKQLKEVKAELERQVKTVQAEIEKL